MGLLGIAIVATVPYVYRYHPMVRDTYAAIQGENPEGLPTFADGVRSAHPIQAVPDSAKS